MIVAVLCACSAPETCSDEDERALARAVDILVEDQGRAAGEAESVIAARGVRAVAVLETAIYNADEAGRKRVIRTLVRIGHPEVAPILRKLAEADQSEGVRREAIKGLAKLGATDPR